MGKEYCKNCGKIYNEAEYLMGQCNECDPFEDDELMYAYFGEPEYMEDFDE